MSASELLPPEPGQIVVVRGRPAVVIDVKPSGHRQDELLHCVDLDYVDEYIPQEETVLWERERRAELLGSLEFPNVGRTNPENPEKYAAFVDAQHWMNAADIVSPQAGGESPMTAAWRSAVQVEDYQLAVVQKALTMPRVRLLLADDVGLGKTVEAGLVLSELIVQRRIRRILIITPASLQTQWAEEMKEKFSLDFTVMNRQQQRIVERERGLDVNPWTQFPRIITSMHYLKQPAELDRFMMACHELEGVAEGEVPAQLAWDLLIVDEAHNLAPNRQDGFDSQLCDMLRDVGPRAEHRLFLTATPHNGFTESFTGLLELLDPVRFQQRASLSDEDKAHVRLAVIRRMKRDVLNADGSPRFQQRRVDSVSYQLTAGSHELSLFSSLRAYKQAVLSIEKRGKRSDAVVGFAMALLTKRLLSSPYAFARTWYRHTAGLRSESGTLQLAEQAKKDAEVEVEDDAVRDSREQEAARTAGAWLRQHKAALGTSISQLDATLLAMNLAPDTVYADHPFENGAPGDSKIDALVQWISTNLRTGTSWNGERVLIFTEYVDTLKYILHRFGEKGWKEPNVAVLSGGSSDDERSLIKARFNDRDSDTHILVATDAAAEGLNLQHTCRYLFHVEVPWNPMRLEQRNGRLDRHGQEREVVAHHFTSPQAEETAMLDYVARKANTVREDLGKIGKILDEALMKKFKTEVSEEDWKVQTDSKIDALVAHQNDSQDESMQLADRGGLESQQKAGQSHERWSQEFGLSEQSLRRMFEHGVSASKGELAMDEEEGFFRWKSIPPSWKPMVEGRMVLAKGAGRLKMCFDEQRMRGEGKNRWRKDAALLRLGHPAMTKAAHRLQRLLWESEAMTTNPFSRWTLEISDEVNEPTVEIATLRIARNQLKESVRAQLHRSVYALETGEHRNSGPSIPLGDRLPGDIPRPLLMNVATMWSASKQNIEASIHGHTQSWLDGLDEQLEAALESALDDEKKAFRRQIRELKKSTERSEQAINKIKFELERWEEKSNQLTLEGYRLPEAVEKTEEAKAKLADAEFKRRKVMVDAQVERLERDRERVLNHVIPQRFSRRGEAQVWPLGVRVILPTSEVNA